MERYTQSEVTPADLWAERAFLTHEGSERHAIPESRLLHDPVPAQEQITGTVGHRDEPGVTLWPALERYRPDVSWFVTPDRARSPISDTGHAARVLVLSELLANRLEREGTVSGLDRTAIRWSAVLHDIRRTSDFLPDDHARRAAEWVYAMLPSDVPELTRQRVFHIISLHDVPDRELAADVPELKILKDADELDRYRFDRLLPDLAPDIVRNWVGTDPDVLRYRASRDLIPISRRLYDLSKASRDRYYRNPFDAVMTAATQLGYMRSMASQSTPV